MKPEYKPLINQPSLTPYKILHAEPEQAEDLTAIALAAKRYWRYPDAWIEAWRPLLTISPGYIQAGEVYQAVQAGEILGFYALSLQGELATLEHLWVQPQAIGKGVGRALFQHATERARSLGARRLEIESDPNADGFYRKMGARRCGERLTTVLGQERRLPLLVVEL